MCVCIYIYMVDLFTGANLAPKEERMEKKKNKVQQQTTILKMKKLHLSFC